VSLEKVFQIGFNKCATRSISHFFKRHGFEVADWERGEIARALKSDIDSGRAPLAAWDKVNVFTDMESVERGRIIEGYKYFRELASAYPQALFVLNTRNVETWIRSRHAHGKGAYTAAYAIFLGLGTDAEVFRYWRIDWFHHHLEVLRYFSELGRPRLFVWDIDSPDFVTLGQIAGMEFDPAKWPHRGKTFLNKEGE
jgi:hypothetical protein